MNPGSTTTTELTDRAIVSESSDNRQGAVPEVSNPPTTEIVDAQDSILPRPVRQYTWPVASTMSSPTPYEPRETSSRHDG